MGRIEAAGSAEASCTGEAGAVAALLTQNVLTLHTARDCDNDRSVLLAYSAVLLWPSCPDVVFRDYFRRDIQHLGLGWCGPLRTLSQAVNLLPPCALGPAPVPAMVQGEGANLGVGTIIMWL